MVEIVDTAVLPSWLQSIRPVWIGRSVGPKIDGGGGPLEYIEMFGPCAQRRNDLNAGGTGPDNANPLVGQFDEFSRLVAAGIFIIPPAGVEGVPLEGLYSGNARQLWLDEQSVGQDNRSCRDIIVAIS